MSLRFTAWVQVCVVATVLTAALGLSLGTARADMGKPPINGLFLVDELEFGFDNQENPLSWEVSSWVGGDWNRIWFKSEGEVPTDSRAVDAEAQVLYSRLIAPFWEFQVGLRGDLLAENEGRDGRGHLVIGLEGLAPYWFEIEPAIFISHRGDVSFRVHASHDLFITQRFIMESSVEINLAIQSVPEFGVGAGLSDLDLGVRFRYEFSRKFAPYVGASWEQTTGKTAKYRRAEGLRAGNVRGIVGLRFWF